MSSHRMQSIFTPGNLLTQPSPPETRPFLQQTSAVRRPDSLQEICGVAKYWLQRCRQFCRTSSEVVSYFVFIYGKVSKLVGKRTHPPVHKLGWGVLGVVTLARSSRGWVTQVKLILTSNELRYVFSFVSLRNISFIPCHIKIKSLRYRRS